MLATIWSAAGLLVPVPFRADEAAGAVSIQFPPKPLITPDQVELLASPTKCRR